MTAGSGTIAVEVLTRARAEKLTDELLTMTADVSWDDWNRENLLAPRPQKWELSLLAVDGSAPVGWAVASRTGGTVHLHHLVVAPQHRSSGVGTVLVRHLLEASRPLPVTLKVHPENEAGIRFYRRLGFVESGTTPSGYRCFTLRPEGDKGGSER